MVFRWTDMHMPGCLSKNVLLRAISLSPSDANRFRWSVKNPASHSLSARTFFFDLFQTRSWRLFLSPVLPSIFLLETEEVSLCSSPFLYAFAGGVFDDYSSKPYFPSQRGSNSFRRPWRWKFFAWSCEASSQIRFAKKTAFCIPEESRNSRFCCCCKFHIVHQFRPG